MNTQYKSVLTSLPIIEGIVSFWKYMNTQHKSVLTSLPIIKGIVSF